MTENRKVQKSLQENNACTEPERLSESAIRSDYERLTKTLIEKNLTITTMESCTSGQIISLITDTEGSSAVVKGAYVTYSNEAKIMQGVSARIIEKYGVYSKETAEAMARACKKSYGSNIGVGVTGTLGNVDVNNHDSVPGHVYFAIVTDENADAGETTECQKANATSETCVCKKVNASETTKCPKANATSETSVCKKEDNEKVYVYERGLLRWPTRYQYKLEIARAVVDELLAIISKY